MHQKLDTVNDKNIFKEKYFRKTPCKCTWSEPTIPQGWQSVLENIEANVRDETSSMIITQSAGYIIPTPIHPWAQSLIETYKEFKLEDEYIQAHLYISLFGFSELFKKHNDIGQNLFIVAGEGSADWTIDGYEDFVVGPSEILYLPGEMYHYARSKGPRYSISVVIESEESYNRNSTNGEFLKK